MSHVLSKHTIVYSTLRNLFFLIFLLYRINISKIQTIYRISDETHNYRTTYDSKKVHTPWKFNNISRPESIYETGVIELTN